jgi:hypothetical protein
MKLARTASAVAVAAVGAWVLYTFAPTAYAFYPKCVFRSVTGLLCPGCGITRAAHHLLHGRFDEAFRLNPMVFVLIALVLYALPSIYRGQTPRFLMSPAFAWGSFVVLTSYWIVRNTPVWPY